MKTKRRLLSWILAVCMIFQAMPSVASAAELVDGSLSFDLSISVAEGTQAPENYRVEDNVVNADGADVNGSGYAGIVSGSDGTCAKQLQHPFVQTEQSQGIGDCGTGFAHPVCRLLLG